MPRLAVLDLWRSLCVWMMLAYHFCYDLAMFGLLPEDMLRHPLTQLWRTLGAGGFILLSGFCVRYSRSPYRRAALVFGAGLLVSAAGAAVRMPVRFGVLHLLGLCMGLYGLFRNQLERLSGTLLVSACALLFILTDQLTGRVGVEVKWLFPLGLKYPGFLSMDYFPLLPWMFLFFCGTGFGMAFSRRRFRSGGLRGVSVHPALTFCGRHSLIIYLLHQPVFFLLLLVSGHFWPP